MLTSDQVQVMNEMGAPRYSVLVRIKGATKTHRAWLGFGDLPVAADDLEPEASIYLGVGKVGSVPALRQLIGGRAERLEIVLDGVNPEVLSLADDQPEEVRDAPVNLGLILFDADWQQVGPIAWLWDGVADMPAVDREGQARSVTLSIGSALTDRAQPRFGYWTPTEQMRRSPSDRFCERTPLYDIGSTIKFPG